MTPPLRGRNFVSFFMSGGVTGEVFGWLGRWKFGAECGFAHGLRVGCGEGRAGGALPADCAPAGGVTCQKCYVVGNDPCVVPVWGERYLLTTMEFCTRVPRSRLLAPLRGSTPRHFQLYCSFLQRDAAPLRMTRRVCRSVRYNRSVARLLKRNKIVPLTQKSPHGVILSGAAQISKIKR